MRIRCVCTLVGAVALGCGSDDGGGTGGQPNRAPELVTAGPVQLQQGRSAAVTLELSDADGDEVAVSFVAPAGLTAAVTDGVLELHADYSLSGSVALPITLDDGAGGVTGAELPLEVAPMAWGAATEWGPTEGPEAREHGAFIVDEAGGRALLLGGSGYSPYLEPLSDAWSLDLASRVWTDLGDTGLPGGGSRRVASVPGESVAYAFGGYGANGAADDLLLRIDYGAGGVSVSGLEQSVGPQPRSLHAFVYDAQLDAFFLFGGVGNTGVLDDTWRLDFDGDRGVWTPILSDASPGGRYGFFYGFDAERGRLIVFSGARGTSAIDPAPDTWALETRAEPPRWVLLNDGTGAPPGRRNGCFVMDRNAPRLFVFGGTADAMTTEPGLHVFDARPGAEAWTELALPGQPPVRSSGFGFHDPTRDAITCGFGNTATGAFRDLAAVGY